jgi:hypothetical protein
MENQQQERRSHKSHKRSSSRRMEEDLNRSSFRHSGDSAGRPPPDKVPRTSGADPCAAPKGTEPSCHRKSSSQSHSGYEPSLGTIPVIITQAPPQGGYAAAVASVPANGQPGDGSNVGERGADPTGFEHGADYGGQLATRKNSSLVNDAEAASRVEYRYQQVRGHASRTPAYKDPFACPTSPSGRRSSLRSSFDSREGESQSSQVFQRMEGIMARMEQHLAASTSASSKPASTPSTTGEFHSFIFISELLIFACKLWKFMLTFFSGISHPSLSFFVRSVT